MNPAIENIAKFENLITWEIVLSSHEMKPRRVR